MRKIYLMLASMALPLLATAAESVPYASDMTTWQIENVNKDEKTWQIDTSGYGNWSKGIKYSWNNKEDADDWAISPAIHLEGGVEYKVKIYTKCSSSYDERYALYYATSNQPDDLKMGSKLIEETNYKQGNYERKLVLFTPEETGDYHFGLYCFSLKDKMTLYATGFEVAENKFAPASVTGLKVVEGADRALEATLSWTLPTTDTDDAAFPEGYVVEKVNIYRDGELAEAIEEAATTWTDNAEKGLVSGVHTYQVEVTVNNATSAKATVVSKYIGPLTAAELPWTFVTKDQLSSKDDFNLFFTAKKGDGSQTTDNQLFSFYSAVSPGNYINYTPNKTTKINDWLFLPPVKVEETGIYRLLASIGFTTTTQDLEVWVCSADNIDSKIRKVGTISEFTSSSPVDYFVAFNIEEAGDYVFAFHTTGEHSSYSPIKFHKFSIEEWYEAPTPATNLSVDVEESGIAVKWTNPTKSNLGADIESLSKVEIYRDDEVVATLTSDITPGEESSYTDVPENGGSFKYHVIPFIGDKAAEGTALTAQSNWYGDKVQDLPYSYTLMDLIKNKLYTALDINNDGFTWDIPASSWPTLNFSNATTDGSSNHDRILTPPFKFDKAGYYHVVVKVRGGATNSHLKVGLVKEDATEAALIDPQSIDAVGYNSEKERSLRFQVENTGRYCLGIDFDEFFSKSDMSLKISGISVEYLPVLPSVATDLAVTPGENYAHTATLEWTNPSTSNIEGVTPTLVKAVISRNDEQVAEITENLVPGEKSTWVDNEVPGAGHHIYTVEIHGEDGPHAEAAPSVKSRWIGRAEEDIPYTQENFEAWTLINVDGDENTWGDPLSWRAESGVLRIFVGSKLADDWAISPRMNFDEGDYDITFTPYKAMGDSDTYSFDLYFGTGTEKNDMTHKIATVTSSTAQGEKVPQTFYISAVDPSTIETLADEEEEAPAVERVKVPTGVGTIGFYAGTRGDYHLTDFSVSKAIETGIKTIEVSNGFAISGSVVLLPENASDVVVADIAGRIIFVADHADSIDLSAFEKGTYVISAVVDGKKAQVKVIR